MESYMRDHINHFLDILDLLVVRLTIFILLAVGAYTLIRGHLSPARRPDLQGYSCKVRPSQADPALITWNPPPPTINEK
jgi:hypothetical protein